jgi:DNA-binding MarR family transcriptional regulator
VTALAEAEGVRPQSMGATIAVLREAGLISGSPDPNDGRQTVLSLTPACLEALKASRTKREDWLFQGIRQRLSPSEQKTLAEAIGLLQRLVE